MEDFKLLNGRYTLEAEIGRGGMGTVYRARDLKLERTVAIKVLPPEFSRDPLLISRFKNEILNTAKLQHANIVAMYDVGTDDNINYYVMQYIEGQDLKDLLTTQGRIPEADIIKYLGQIAAALDYAHLQGIIHRDIKPENILVDKYGVAHVTDFGIARSMEGTRMTSGVLGTPEYMSPEQAQGNDVDGQTDQYSLAIIAYEMYTGTTPFRTTSSQPWSLVNAHINIPPPNPRQMRGEIADHVVVSLMQALAKLPQYRFATCAQFAAAISGRIAPAVPAEQLIKFTSAAPTEQQPAFNAPAPPQPPVAKHNNQSTIVIILGIIVLLLLFGGGMLLVNQSMLNARINDQENKIAEDSQAEPEPSPPDEQIANEYKDDAFSEPVEGELVVDDAATNEYDIKNLLERWRSSFLSRDINEHMLCYAPAVEIYFGKRNVMRNEIRTDKVRGFNMYTDMRQCDITDIKYSETSPGLFTVSFDKEWDCRGAKEFSGSEREELILKRIDSKLYIVSERELEIYWVNK